MNIIAEVVYITEFEFEPVTAVLYREYGYTTEYTFGTKNFRNLIILLDKLEPGKTYEINLVQLYSNSGLPGLSTVIVEKTYGKRHVTTWERTGTSC